MADYQRDRRPPGMAAVLSAVSIRTPSNWCARPVANGASSDEQIVAFAVDKLKKGELHFAVEDPDNPANFPRVLFLWRANLLGASGKGHEYFLKHLLGVDNRRAGHG